MSIFEKKEKNLSEIINKLSVLTSTYSHFPNDSKKIKTEKDEILRQKTEIEIDLPEIFFSDILHDGQHKGNPMFETISAISSYALSETCPKIKNTIAPIVCQSNKTQVKQQYNAYILVAQQQSYCTQLLIQLF